MLAKNSSNGVVPASKSTKPTQNPFPKMGIKTRSTTKKSVIGVSNISVSIRSSKKATDSSKTKHLIKVDEPIAPSNSEIGVQVDEVEIIANDCERSGESVGDAPVIRLPSAKIIREIERIRQKKKEQALKARLTETRKFEGHAAKQEIHLNNLREFMDTGAIARKRDGDSSKEEETMKVASEKTKNAIEAYDRIKQKEEELMKLFNSI